MFFSSSDVHGGRWCFHVKAIEIPESYPVRLVSEQLLLHLEWCKMRRNQPRNIYWSCSQVTQWYTSFESQLAFPTQLPLSQLQLSLRPITLTRQPHHASNSFPWRELLLLHPRQLLPRTNQSPGTLHGHQHQPRSMDVSHWVVTVFQPRLTWPRTNQPRG
jgi:hypothetical protein